MDSLLIYPIIGVLSWSKMFDTQSTFMKQLQRFCDILWNWRELTYAQSSGNTWYIF